MTAFELESSVGEGGENRPEDVRRLRERLSDLGFPNVTTGSEVDEATVTAIDLAQSMKSGKTVLEGDGVVDVPAPGYCLRTNDAPDEMWTYCWLRARNAPSWQALPSGSREAGFRLAPRAVESGWTHGSGYLASVVVGAGRFYRDQYLEQQAAAAPLTVDAAGRFATSHPDHRGHGTGMAFDLQLPTADGGTSSEIDPGSARYVRETMRAMLRAVRAQPRVTGITFNDPALNGTESGEDELVLAEPGPPAFDRVAHVEVRPLVPEIGYERPVDELLDRAIRYFGGTPVDPDTYAVTEAGFDSYLSDVGVEHFDADGFLTPHHAEVARQLGYDLFLPPAEWWPRGAALGLLADRLRAEADEPVRLRNWWRPRRYNDDVASAVKSDHITAHGIDLDFPSGWGWSDAQFEAVRRSLVEIDRDEPWLEMSRGAYEPPSRALHVGLLSPRKGRSWGDAYWP